jgi:hypothetical protein
MWKKRRAYYNKCAYKIVFGSQLELIESSDDDTATEEKDGCLIIDDDDESE